GKGEITKAVNVVANAFSKSAAEKIQAAGGTATVIE
ncbi:MAG: uL15 family ribosomal protein, partial [Bacteroidales bacterium]|nr:uL15 family ribosomal protein [Bacteroidales bacterium]